MSPIYLTDLDDTLFQTIPKCPANGGDLRLMSTLADGTPSGYATQMQQNLMAWMSKGLVVPVTARGRDVLARVDITQAPAICSNGGCILDDMGELDHAWHDHLIQQSATTDPVLRVYQALTDGLCTTAFRHWSVEENGLDLYIVIKSNLHDEDALVALEREFQTVIPTGWRCHRNGNNLAYLPPWLNKRHAVRYLINHYRNIDPSRPILGLGDSVSDAGFMDLCDFAMIPTGSQLWSSVIRDNAWVD